MRIALAVAALALVASTAALAADPTCESQAADKKLNGAAKTSFVKKCQADAVAAAKASCASQAADKKLNGAAKTSFVTKCVKDATAPADAPK